MTVAELIEDLNKFPKDYKIGLRMNYQDWTDHDQRAKYTDDFASFYLDEQNKSVTIITYN